MPGLKAQYVDAGKVQFIYRDFPLNLHPRAEPAAIAARCAGEQNADLEMFDSCPNGAKLKGKLSGEIKLRSTDRD